MGHWQALRLASAVRLFATGKADALPGHPANLSPPLFRPIRRLEASRAMSSTSEFEQGLKHLADRRWAAAIERLTAAQALEPGRFAIARALATAHLHKQDADAARQILADFIRDNP